MVWTVETLGEAIDAEIAALPPKIQAKLLWIMEQIEARGLPSLRPPHMIISGVASTSCVRRREAVSVAHSS